MLNKLIKQFNHGYGRMLLNLGKWGLLFFILSIFFLGVGVKFVLPAGMKKLKEDSNLTVVKDSEGGNRNLYKDKAIPTDFQGEISASGPELIYENQARSAKTDGGVQHGASEDDRSDSIPGAKMPLAEQERVTVLTKRFLGQWETFSSSTTKEEYRAQLAPFLDAQALESTENSIVQRRDNDQPDMVGPGKPVGSRLAAQGFVPDRMMTTRRYGGGTAYMTTIGEIVLSGDSLVLDNKKYIRSYALILRKSINGEWKVVRVVAKTLKEIIE